MRTLTVVASSQFFILKGRTGEIVAVLVVPRIILMMTRMTMVMTMVTSGTKSKIARTKMKMTRTMTMRKEIEGVYEDDDGR